MRKRRRVSTQNTELKTIYDNYVDAKHKGNEADALHYAKLAKEIMKDYRYPQPEFTDRTMWLKMQKETWGH